MLDCTTETYDLLYARWLENRGALLDWAGFHPDKHQLLDLCGGTGAVAREAVHRGAKRVWLLDLNPRVDDQIPRITPIQGPAEDLKSYPGYEDDPPIWDLVVCRQAIGYLDLGRLESTLREVIRPGGRFVFNTFDRPRWGLKTYLYADHDSWKKTRYWEASAYLGRRCFHLQAMEGDFDITSFHWYTEKDIRRIFKTWTLHNFKQTPSTLWFSYALA